MVVYCSSALQASLQTLEATATNTRRSIGRTEPMDDFDCTVCLKLLFDPVTTPCGHSFCHSCLLQSMDRGQCTFLLVFSFPLFYMPCNDWSYFLIQVINALCVARCFLSVQEHALSGKSNIDGWKYVFVLSSIGSLGRSCNCFDLCHLYKECLY